MLYLIPLLPFLGFLVNTAFRRHVSKGVSGAVATGAMGLAFGVSIAAVARLLASEPVAGVRAIEETIYTWMASGTLDVAVAFRLDPLSAVMVLVVTGIGALIHLYSTAYMHDETPSEFARYFAYLNLFAAFMLVLVLASGFPLMFVGWEGVGLCSYLLIGFWFTRQAAADAGKKAFVVNRVGDFAFLLGMFGLFGAFGSLDFQVIARQAAGLPIEAGFGALTGLTLLLFIGATGKSAQIPLHVWLPDAMEGPTPVSALIHAATMVTAGVYMIARNAVLFSHAPVTMEIVAVVGALTAVVAATIGLVQNDIKRVLAYSTISQLGYMFLAVGVGAFAGGIFHLYTHAFFKALLFLGAGAVIHALHGEQDLRNMGGLRRDLPVTYWTFLAGTMAIAGVPLLSGFFSKDEILWRTFESGHPVLWAVGVATAFLTACYMFRLLYLAFAGTPARGAHGEAPRAVHDAPASMAIVLVVLAAGSIVAGYVGVPEAIVHGGNRIERFLAPSFRAPGAPEVVEADEHRAGLEVSLMAVSTMAALAGIGLATVLYRRRTTDTAAGVAPAGAVQRILINKYYVDEIYDAVVIQPVKYASTVLWRGIDAGLVDGTVNGAGLVIRGWSSVIRRLQTGSVRAYAMGFFGGVVVIVGYYLWQ